MFYNQDILMSPFDGKGLTDIENRLLKFTKPLIILQERISCQKVVDRILWYSI